MKLLSVLTLFVLAVLVITELSGTTALTAGIFGKGPLERLRTYPVSSSSSSSWSNTMKKDMVTAPHSAVSKSSASSAPAYTRKMENRLREYQSN